MKMNHLDALLRVLERFENGGLSELRAYSPRRFEGTLGGEPLVRIASRPILAMRHFSKTKRLSDEVVERVAPKNRQVG